MGLYSIQYLVFLVVVAAVYLHLPQRVQPAVFAGGFVGVLRRGPRSRWAAPGTWPFTHGHLRVFIPVRGAALAGAAARTRKRLCAWVSIGSLAILAFFKYFGFLETALGLPFAIVMPLGISFYSFAAIAYLIDAARGDCEVEKSPLRYALFLMFFGTVTQGPIPRAGQLDPPACAGAPL